LLTVEGGHCPLFCFQGKDEQARNTMPSLERTIIARVEPLVRDVVEHEGMELVDVTYQREPHGWVLRVFIDRQGGVTVEDCGAVSSQLGDILDVHDVIPHRYRLEVSSPGVNRPLKTAHDFNRFLGSAVRVTTGVAIENRRHFKGLLCACDGATITLAIDGKDWQIPLRDVRKACLDGDGAGAQA